MSDTPHELAKGKEKEVLRVALDQEAARAYFQMAEKLKATNAHVKVQPSQFVSYLVADFFETYFEKDIDVLVAEFFDSQSFYKSETQHAKREGSFEVAMDKALTAAKRIKSKRRRKPLRNGKTGNPHTDAVRHEKVQSSR